MGPESQFVFGYGSLVTGSGPGPAPGRGVHPNGFVAELPGHRRSWGVAMDNRRDLPGYKYYTDARGRRPGVCVAFLDVSPADGHAVTGLCLPVDAARLRRLDQRERNYERVDVSDRIDAGGARVWTYMGRPDARRRLSEARAAGTAVIDAHYLDAVRGALAWLGDSGGDSLHDDGLPVVALRRHALP